jgi:hypothetical protein
VSHVALLLALALLAPAALAVPGSGLADLRARGLALAHAATPPATDSVAELARFAWSRSPDLAGLRPVELPALRATSLADAVRDAYAGYGWPAPTPEEMARMRTQEARLDPALAASAAGLLEDLAGHVPIVRDVQARALRGGVVQATAHDGELLQGSALRIARGADDVARALRGLDARSVPAAGGFLFRDPYDLVLVGDAGANAYAGNTLGQPLVNPRANLLTIDLGGDDVYTGTAGGAYPTSPCYYYTDTQDPFGGQHHQTNYVLPDPGDPRLGLCGDGIAAAASIDLAGDDRYAYDGTFGLWQHQAAQGSGQFFGVGLLLDLAGNDTYESTSHEAALAYQAVQGSGGNMGFYAFGFLVDGGGRDLYQATMTTVPHAGSANYSQQRAQAGGEGLLADLGGEDDVYQAQLTGPANAWVMAQASVGDLLDFGGDDEYLALQQSGNMSVQADQGEDGLLFDAAGNDLYQAELRCTPACVDQGAWQNVQGSAEAGGTGELVDAAGDDLYYASSNGEQHNQASGVLAPTVLIDLAGQDRYLDVQAGAAQYAQAAGKGALSVLLDAQGDDRYTVLHLGPGEQWAQGASGSTTTPCPPPTPPPLVTSVASALLDLGGDDVYTATMDTPGQVQVVQGAGAGAGGVLVDCAGTNSYSDPQAGQGVWTQGATGVGVDCARLLASLP